MLACRDGSGACLVDKRPGGPGLRETGTPVPGPSDRTRFDSRGLVIDGHMVVGKGIGDTVAGRGLAPETPDDVCGRADA
jgi:hypothetical protein